jgi:Tfp pilus assembly protein FimT
MNGRFSPGWTLLETMVLIAVIAIVLGISGLAFRDFLPGLHLRGAVSHLVIDLQQARLRAIAQNCYYRLVFSPDQKAYFLERESGNGRNRWPGLPEGGPREFNNPGNPYYHPGVDQMQVSQNPVFSPRGGVFGTTIVLRSGDRQKVITVSSLGRVKVKSLP